MKSKKRKVIGEAYVTNGEYKKEENMLEALPPL